MRAEEGNRRAASSYTATAPGGVTFREHLPRARAPPPLAGFQDAVRKVAPPITRRPEAADGLGLLEQSRPHAPARLELYA